MNFELVQLYKIQGCEKVTVDAFYRNDCGLSSIKKVKYYQGKWKAPGMSIEEKVTRFTPTVTVGGTDRILTFIFKTSIPSRTVHG